MGGRFACMTSDQTTWPAAHASSKGARSDRSTAAISTGTGCAEAAARSSAPPTYCIRPRADTRATRAAMPTLVSLFMVHSGLSRRRIGRWGPLAAPPRARAASRSSTRSRRVAAGTPSSMTSEAPRARTGSSSWHWAAQVARSSHVMPSACRPCTLATSADHRSIVARRPLAGPITSSLRKASARSRSASRASSRRSPSASWRRRTRSSAESAPSTSVSGPRSRWPRWCERSVAARATRPRAVRVATMRSTACPMGPGTRFVRLQRRRARRSRSWATGRHHARPASSSVSGTSQMSSVKRSYMAWCASAAAFISLPCTWRIASAACAAAGEAQLGSAVDVALRSATAEAIGRSRAIGRSASSVPSASPRTCASSRTCAAVAAAMDAR